MTEHSPGNNLSENVLDETVSIICSLVDRDFINVNANINEATMSLCQGVVMSLLQDDRINLVSLTSPLSYINRINLSLNSSMELTFEKKKLICKGFLMSL